LRPHDDPGERDARLLHGEGLTVLPTSQIRNHITKKGSVMKIPTETKPAAWGAIGGAIVLAIVGFSWGGWVTGGSSAQAAKHSADTAVVAALAPICATQFRVQADADSKLTELKALSSYERSDFVVKGGWATMPGSETPVNGVASSCVDILTAA
jgi:hypothetical protein